MAPTIGRTVVYKTTQEQRSAMGNQAYCNIQEELPATVVAVWSEDCINLKVHLDGEGDIWVTSALKGNQQGQWDWPKIV